jgi:8-oxo-dGTP diphosphatase|tara:strand:+ start:63 stop:470 length:408 start_codon:yes stop_codon:yes gene_type:complete
MAKSRAMPVAAKGVILRDGRFLLIRKTNGTWDLPGGKLMRGEDVEEGLVREILEETGLETSPKALLDCFVRHRKNGKGKLVVTYLCDEVAGGDEIELSEEHVEARFYSADEVFDLDFNENYERTFRRLIDRAGVA